MTLETFTKGGEWRGGVQAIPRRKLAFRRRRTIGDKDVVVVIGCQWQGEPGHPGRVTDLWENIICKQKERHLVQIMGFWTLSWQKTVWSVKIIYQVKGFFLSEKQICERHLTVIRILKLTCMFSYWKAMCDLILNWMTMQSRAFLWALNCMWKHVNLGKTNIH